MHFNKLIPELSVSNLSTSVRFYVEILGFRVDYDRPADGFVFLSLGGAQLMLEQDNGHWATGRMESPRGRGINFQIEVKDLGCLYERVQGAGLAVFRERMQRWRRAGGIEHGEVEFLIQDPDGYLLRFSESIGERAISV